MLDVVKRRLGPEAADRLVEPRAVEDSKLKLGRSTLEVIEYGSGEAKHNACLHLPDRHAFVASDLIYNGAHLYLLEHNLEGWLDRLSEFEQYAAGEDIQTIFPGHGPAGGLSLIAGTREYLEAFAAAVKSGSADRAREAMLARFPNYHAEMLLTLFSLPAYFPAKDE